MLSYNLFWWHLFKVEGGRGGSAGHLIRSTSEPPYDVMGFQECEDPERVLGPAGLLQDRGEMAGSGMVWYGCPKIQCFIIFPVAVAISGMPWYIYPIFRHTQMSQIFEGLETEKMSVVRWALSIQPWS